MMRIVDQTSEALNDFATQQHRPRTTYVEAMDFILHSLKIEVSTSEARGLNTSLSLYQ